MLTITDKQLAEIIGRPPRPDGKIIWNPDDLIPVTIALRALMSLNQDDSYLVDSETMPHWLHLTIAYALSNKELSIKDLENGPVRIPTLPCQTTGEGLTFYVSEEADLTLVDYSLGRRIAPEDLSSIILPTVNSDKGVVIAGNAPPWLTVAIGLTYASNVPWVAATQKSRGAIVSLTKITAMPAGTLIDQEKLARAQENANLRTRLKRGDIWWFEYSGKSHPGLIISCDEANDRLEHVLIVPITSTPWRSAQNLVSLPSASVPGLSKDSFAICEDLSKVDIKDLGNGPYATINDDLLMQKIIQQIRLVIGDDTAAA